MKCTMFRHVSLLLVMVILVSLFSGCESGNVILQNNDIANKSCIITQASFLGQRVTNKEEAMTAINTVAEQLGMADAANELTTCREQNYFDTNFYRFDQSYQGIPVYGRSVILAANEYGTVQVLTHNYQNVDGINIEPKLTMEQALEVVNESYPEVTSIIDEGLCIYSLDGTTPTLTWQFQVSYTGNVELCFVDAQNGDVVNVLYKATCATGSYSTESEDDEFGIRDNMDGTYSLVDEARNIEIYDAKGKTVNTRKKGTDFQIFTNVNKKTLEPVSNDSTIWNESKATQAMVAVAKTYDFFKEVYNVDSFDNENGKALVVTDTLIDESGYNASSLVVNSNEKTYFVLRYGKDWKISDNIITHEYAHAVEGCISDMAYKNESGAIKEAIADVFAILEETWQPEETDKNKLMDGKGDWCIELTARFIYNPGLSGYPVAYSDNNFYQLPMFYLNRKYQDNFVHINSTVISYACYLMVNPEKSTVDSLSNYELGQLLLLSMHFFSTNCDFYTFSDIVMTSAKLMDLSEKKQEAVFAALDATQIVRPGYSDDSEYRLDYILNPQSNWQLLNENSEYCDNYTVTVSSLCNIDSFYTDEFYVMEDETKETYTVTDAKPFTLDLKPDYVYGITFTDGRDKSRIAPYIVGVVNSGGQEEIIEIKTDFISLTEDNLPEMTEKTEETDIALGYPAVIQKIMERCHYNEISNGEKLYNQGVLMDINYDGVDELIVQSYYNEQYQFEIWGMKSDTAVQLFTTGLTYYSGLWYETELYFAMKDEIPYLLQYEYSYGHSSQTYMHTIYSINMDSIQVEHTAKIGASGWFENGQYVSYNGCSVDGEPCESEVYDTLLAQFQNQQTILAMHENLQLCTEHSMLLSELLAVCSN